MKKLPITPYPTPGEIVFECAVRSGLVQSNEPSSALYDDLKSFRDDRRRPGLDPVKFIEEGMRGLELRMGEFLGDKGLANVLTLVFFDLLEAYSGIMANFGAGLLEREQIVERVLWPSYFGFAGTTVLRALHGQFPTCSPMQLLEAESPVGYYLQRLCTQGKKDFDAICAYFERSSAEPVANFRETLDAWLSGDNVPSLSRLKTVLRALELDARPEFLIWLPVARLLAKTSKPHKAWLKHWLDPDIERPQPIELLWQLRNHAGLEHGKTLNIGLDRPFAKLKAALYDASVPRDSVAVEDMLARLEKTWEPIADKTRSTVDWLWGRYLVLSGNLQEGLMRYEAAYEHGIGRDTETYEYILDEALAVAGALGKMRKVKRFHGILGLYWKTEWDGDEATLGEHFLRKFPENLRFITQ